ncbi:unnamed protein product [Ectocarpus sp. CCAP 1310/34]|nr:unnamed protein product [Ectocarpus sp. CCAP 1310/34]
MSFMISGLLSLSRSDVEVARNGLIL